MASNADHKPIAFFIFTNGTKIQAKEPFSQQCRYLIWCYMVECGIWIMQGIFVSLCVTEFVRCKEG